MPQSLRQKVLVARHMSIISCKIVLLEHCMQLIFCGIDTILIILSKSVPNFNVIYKMSRYASFSNPKAFGSVAEELLAKHFLFII